LNNPQARGVGVAATPRLPSAATLVCCVLPAVMVALGAGAALVGLIAAFPQLVWLSEHKGLVFGVAAILLALAGVFIWRARKLPCPTDPAAARLCNRLRAFSHWLYGVAVVSFLAGAVFAFVLPRLA
jgi:hypothetical protein